MLRTARMPWLPLTALVVLVPELARAEVIVAESTEWVLATSERAVAGKVVKVDDVLADDRQNYQVLTVAVSRTLKGQHAERASIVVPPHIHKGYAKHWMNDGIPIVFCLTLNDGKGTSLSPHLFPWVMRTTESAPHTILLGNSKHVSRRYLPVLTRDFQVLTEPDAILKFLDKTIESQPRTVNRRSHALELPGSSPAFEKLWAGSAVLLVVPVDDALEALGVKWCQSRSPYERMHGATILRHFESDRNVALLKGLLDDPSSFEQRSIRAAPGMTGVVLVQRTTSYYVRQSAYNSLRALGVQVERPVLEILVEGRDEPEPKNN